MQDYFDEPVARTYDDASSSMFDAALLERTAEFLAAHAAGGPVLEFGIGTGRVALPLARMGLEVHGIDLSPAMVAGLAAKPGGAAVPVTMGSFAEQRAPGTFRLVYLVFNTIQNLTSQAEQVACFRNAAAHLSPGGRFVIETGVPDLQRLPPGETLRPFDVRADHVGVDEYDVVEQRLVSHHYRIDGAQVQVVSIPFRYAWPAEFDLMAQLAGMSLVERWADWDRSPFTATSAKHVSVWQRV